MKESYRQMHASEQFSDFMPIKKSEEMRDKKGCVMRSLESALGVPATNEEWNCRLEYVNAASDILALAKKYNPECKNDDQAKPHLQEIDRQDILYMIQSFSLNDSSVGWVLSQMDISLNIFPGERIMDLVTGGETEVLLFDYGGKSPHLAHLGIDSENNITSQSDKEDTLNFDIDAEYFAVTLTPIQSEEIGN